MSDIKRFEMPKPKNNTSFSLEKKKSANWNDSPEYTKLHTSDRWKKLRNLQLSEFPVCLFCDHPATQVHRINPKNMNLFFDRNNHASICEECHEKVSQAYRRGISTEILFKKKDEPCQV